jgi:hypothetical protein
LRYLRGYPRYNNNNKEIVSTPHLFTVATASGAGKLYMKSFKERRMGIWEIETGDLARNRIKGESQETYL